MSKGIGTGPAEVIPLDLADHDLVRIVLHYKPSIITARDFSAFDRHLFNEHLRNIPLNLIFNMPVNDKIAFLNSNLIYLFNVHAPIKTITVSKPKQAWIAH